MSNYKSHKLLVIGNAGDKWVKRFISRMIQCQWEIVLINSMQEETEENVKYYQYYKDNSVTLLSIPSINSYTRSLKCVSLLKAYGVFDVCHIMGVSEYACLVATLLAEKKQLCAVVANYFGSDFYSTVSLQIRREQKMLLDIADAIIVPIDKMQDEVLLEYPEFLGKVHTVYFESGVLHYLKNQNTALLEKRLLPRGIRDNKIVIAAGYKRGEYQQHELIINALKACSKEVKEKIQVIFMMTYGVTTEEYDFKIREILKNEDFEYLIVDTFLSEEQMAVLRMQIDIFINTVRTDAFNAAIQESLWSQSVVMCGNWLNYPDLDVEGAYVITFGNERELAVQLTDVIFNLSEYKEKSLCNRAVIQRISDKRKNVENWMDFYPQLNMQNNNVKSISQSEILLHIANKVEVSLSRSKDYTKVMELWLQKTLHGQLPFKLYLREKQIHNLVIYGAGLLGRMLYCELSDTEIAIQYCDKNVTNVEWLDSDILKPTELKGSICDLLIITPIHLYSVIRNDIISYLSGDKIVSMEEILLSEHKRTQ